MRRTLALLALLLLVASCAAGRQHSRWLGLDTAQYHLQTGLLFLERDKPEDARRELLLAAELDAGCGLAYCGLTVACAGLARFEEARQHLTKARWLAKDDQAKCQVRVAAMRLLTAERPTGWLEDAEDLYVQARAACPDDPAPAYFMALAYKGGLRLEEAAALLAEVCQTGGDYTARAAEQWRLVERARRSSPRTPLGRELAPRESLSRGELAALLNAELGLGGRWSGPEPADLAQHRLKDQVLPVLALGLDPLRPYADGTFHPDAPVSRAEFAQLVEALLASWRPGSLERSRPARPPYPDVPQDAPHLRALGLCGMRGLLEVRDLYTGALEPNAPLSGADALLAIGRLREQRGPTR